jgi:hypothetical protein
MMFSRLSRYRTLPGVVTTDDEGRIITSATLRLLPAVSGTFQHTIEGGDRLDHLAFKYYGQPRHWWQICDANPEYLSPQALLGKEPIVKTRFEVETQTTGATPAWAALLSALNGRIGVECVQIIEDEAGLVAKQRAIANTQVTVLVPQFKRAVIVTYNQQNVRPGDLRQAITAAGFIAGPPETIGRVGKSIVIPPDVLERSSR